METGHTKSAYRVDIDGLRTFAVLPVVLFHAGVQALGGGYVGVDVFFVISGYLITGILLQDGSITNFYQRRARRILPALLTVLAVTLIVGLILFLPHDLMELSRSTIATLLFSSNIFFWRSAGYFATETELWPLLHTWSLGVEEQFYIFFPLVLLVIKRLPMRWLRLAIWLMTIVSFASSVIAINELKVVLAFYLSPPRAWELLVGSLLAVRALPAITSKPLRTVMAAIGLIAILYPVFTYGGNMRFPGWLALPPVLGSAMVIWAGQDGEHHLVPVLGWAPLKFIGLISYSLYLWHWPVLAFMRYVAVDPISLTQGMVAVLVSIILATLSWRYIERPFRKGFSDKSIWLMSLAGMATLGLASGAVLLAKGLPDRFPPAVAALNSEQGGTWRCPLTSLMPFGGYYACPINLPSRDAKDAQVIFWGDSHALMYIPALQAVLGDRGALLVNANGCAPVASAWSNHHCSNIQQRNYAEILATPAKAVIIAQNWSQYRDEIGKRTQRIGTAEERYMPAVMRLRELVADLRRNGRRVVLVLPVSTPGYEIASIASRDLVYHGGIKTRMGVSYADYRAEYANVLAAMDDMAAHDPEVRLARVDKIACPNGTCTFLRDGHVMFADHGHYAATYAGLFAPAFKQALDGPDVVTAKAVAPVAR